MWEEKNKELVNTVTDDGRTALMFACRKGKYDVAEMLMAGGAEVNTKDPHGVTALMCACDKGMREVAIMLLGQVRT